MAHRSPGHHQTRRSDRVNTIASATAASESSSRPSRIQPSTSSSSSSNGSVHGRQGQVMGFMILLVSGGILLCLTGITLTGTVLGLIFFAPLIIISSPIWVPIGAIMLFCTVSFLWVCGIGAGLIFGLPWVYKYFRGRHPLGSDRIDHARNRILGTANQMRNYAWEYGGYIQSKVKDVAPGA
ncbi:hypothetical protein MKW94_015097 [Papaver nudicaule]|uniref:Oleosin n=1 Tax=Papaver nudicaule TaxID=74823 RepID=A0AA41VK29_PAPNU|nr:hypothetical protein [Papaver nudicaule]